MTIAALPLTRVEALSLDNPLTAAHRRELAAARDRAKSIRKAARVAAFNGWTTALIAALSAPFAIVSAIGMALTVGMAFVAWNDSGVASCCFVLIRAAQRVWGGIRSACWR